MPLKKMTYERTLQLNSEFLKHADGEISTERFNIFVKEMLIRNELMKHDFTKRQLNILIFIANHSFAFTKEEALIPKLQDFEIAGISKSKVKTELEKLENMNVIQWNREVNTFRVLDLEKWVVPFNSGYSEDRARELFMVNVRHAGLDANQFSEN